MTFSDAGFLGVLRVKRKRIYSQIEQTLAFWSNQLRIVVNISESESFISARYIHLKSVLNNLSLQDIESIKQAFFWYRNEKQTNLDVLLLLDSKQLSKYNSSSKCNRNKNTFYTNKCYHSFQHIPIHIMMRNEQKRPLCNLQIKQAQVSLYIRAE